MDQLILEPLQQEAVDLCCDISQRVVGVTGPAGTGKTTILKQVYEALKHNGYKVALCSPTGKAAKRIYEATGIQASTIHRLLEYSHPGDPDPKTGKPIGVSIPRRHRTNPLDFDVLLVDEAAMVNEELHRAMFDALPRGGCIRYFGDEHQLAPIEESHSWKDGPQPPSPFQRMLADKSGKFRVITLDRVFRQGADSGILFNCQLILSGRYPTRNEQFTIRMTDLSVDALRNYILESLNEGIDFSEVQNQIIVPQNKSAVGTTQLNSMIQGMFKNEINDNCMHIDRHPWAMGEGAKKGGQIRIFCGDKVIITSNLYDLHLFNGETGKVIEINEETGEIAVDFGDREQVIPPVLMVQNRHGGLSTIDPRKDLDLAYAITTHKSQGSEYKRVVYILNKANAYMISRRNLYTAVSRAREHVHLIADQRGLGRAISNRD